MKRDPIGEFLRHRLPTTPEPQPELAAPVRRPSAPKIAGLAALALLVVAAGAILPVLLASPGARPPGELPLEAPGGTGTVSHAVGTIELVSGGVQRVRDGEIRPVEPTHNWDGRDELRTGPAGSVGISLDGGHLIVLGPQSRLVFTGSSMGHQAVSLLSGTLAARASDAGRGKLVIESEQARVQARGASFTVEAFSGQIVRVSVHEGEVQVSRHGDGHDVSVPRERSLDTATWSLAPALAEDDLTGKLEALVALVDGLPEAPPVPPVVVDEPDAPPGPSDGHRPPGLAARIRQALDAGDVALAIDLIESEGKGHDDPKFLLAAAEAYRAASQWSEAADSFAAASSAGQGKEAERALIRAAEIRLRKLGDPKGAADLVDEYFMRFPDGEYRDEALYLAAVIQARLGHHVKARSYYESYLASYPDGLQAVRAHVALAQILAIALSDCPSALTHVKAAQAKSKGKAMQAEMAKVTAACPVKETP